MKKVNLFLTLCMSFLVLIGCSSNVEKVPQEPDKEVVLETEEIPEVQDNDIEVDKKLKIMVYYTEDALTFSKSEVEIEELTPKNVFEALVLNGIGNEEIKIIEFNKTTTNEQKNLEIDFSKEFAIWIMGLGSSGEYYGLGSICNTFLEVYDCDKIKITVEGEALETGHNDYSRYLTKFQ